MYRVLALVLTGVIALPAQTLLAAGAPTAGAGATGQISGQAFDVSGRQLTRVTVRLRNLATGLALNDVPEGTGGTFSFHGLRTGNYVVEVGNTAGQVIGTSRIIALAPGQMAATGIGVTAAPEVAVAQAGAGAAAGSFFTTTAGIVVIAAVAAGVAVGVYEVKKSDASPSR
jgi:hypothetical protein